ncbi:hypothetical protein [Formosa sp. A9]|uniref:hypothetical protein n=1 Tax=Formosa sp. A9 TaxID=3442641 RepID=UPI003EC0F65B
MRIIKITLFCIALLTLNNCASGYKTIAPKTINYVSATEKDSIKLEYKYDVLYKRYEKKEVKKGVKVVAVKITNNSKKDIKFGKDAVLIYENGSTVMVMDNDKVFSTIKQNPAIYLLYLLLTPINLYTTDTNSNGLQEETSSFPIGLILGPGIAGGNMIAASTANKKFKTELEEYKIHGQIIKQGETKYGLIGIKSDTFEALNLATRSN